MCLFIIMMGSVGFSVSRIRVGNEFGLLYLFYLYTPVSIHECSLLLLVHVLRILHFVPLETLLFCIVILHYPFLFCFLFLTFDLCSCLRYVGGEYLLNAAFCTKGSRWMNE